ncbi:MAG: hypothetical protein EXR41_05415 [Candidatus Methylopumilus sp.]|nr:hypothetical protein [Candidatus Methylopumilus sp.]
MKYKLQNTLIVTISLLFSNGIYSKENMKTCEKLLDNNQYQEALNQANNALKANKNDYKATFCHGQVNLKLNKNDDALNDFSKADKLAKDNIDHSMARLLQGITLKESKRLDEALGFFKDALLNTQTNMPFKRLYLNEMGEIYLLLNQSDNAAQALIEAYSLAANDNERASNLDRIAYAYAVSKNFSKAIEYELKANLAYDRAGLLGEYADSGINLATYYMEANDLTSAERTLIKFEKLARDNGGMYFLAKALYVESRYYKKKSDLALSQSKLDEAYKIANEIGAEDLKTLFKGN